MSAPKIVRHWLIAAFEPFAGRKQNNSLTVQTEFQKLEQIEMDAKSWLFQFHYVVLPVEYKRCFLVLDEKVKQLAQIGIAIEGVLAIGEGAEEFKLETQGHNLDDVPELADNAGEIRSGKKIHDDYPIEAPFALRFPFEAFSRIRSSKNAGFYICNHLCVEMSYHYGKDDKISYFGFIHVPKTGSGGMFTADVCASVILNGFKKIP
jgi:pyrrolidone-carboxylate peptidase